MVPTENNNALLGKTLPLLQYLHTPFGHCLKAGCYRRCTREYSDTTVSWTIVLDKAHFTSHSSHTSLLVNYFQSRLSMRGFAFFVCTTKLSDTMGDPLSIIGRTNTSTSKNPSSWFWFFNHDSILHNQIFLLFKCFPRLLSLAKLSSSIVHFGFSILFLLQQCRFTFLTSLLVS